MKNFTVFTALVFFWLAPSQVSGQQVNVGAVNPWEIFSTVDMEEVSDGGFVLSGYVDNSSPSGIVVKVSPAGLSLWQKKLGGGTINASTKHNDDVIMVGYEEEGPIAMSINSSGLENWANSYTFSGRFQLQDVKTDPLGTVFVSGIEDSSYNVVLGDPNTRVVIIREMIAKMNSSGVPIWSKKTRDLTNRLTSEVQLRSDSVLVFGDSRYFGEDDISISIYRSSDGALINHLRYYTTVSSNETFTDVIPYQGGYIVAFESTDANQSGGARYTNFVRLDASLNPVGFPWTMVDASFLGGKLATNGTDVFLSGSVGGIGYNASYLAKLNLSTSTPSTYWSKSVVYGPSSGPAPYVTSAMITSAGNVATLANKENSSFGITTVLTVLNGSGDLIQNQTYCDMPQTFPASFSNNWMTRSSVARSLRSLNLTISGSVGFASYDPVVDNCALILPIELLSFTGEAISQTTLLRWQTATEKDNSHFEIERSADGSNSWEEIGQESGAGDSQRLLDYEFVDVSPFNGANYYRLKQVDFDGAFKYSPVVVVIHEGLQSVLSVFPNPLTLGFPLNVKGEFELVQVFDQAGREVTCTKNTMGQLSFGDVVPGMYNLVALRANGSKETARFIIQP